MIDIHSSTPGVDPPALAARTGTADAQPHDGSAGDQDRTAAVRDLLIGELKALEG
jgi:hypothetical protein